MSTKKKCGIPAEKQALYDKLLATNPKIERKGAANPYTSLNGHMFTLLNPAGTLALRLPKKEREEFLKKYKTTLFAESSAAPSVALLFPHWRQSLQALLVDSENHSGVAIGDFAHFILRRRSQDLR